jgi:hypothetical protein
MHASLKCNRELALLNDTQLWTCRKTDNAMRVRNSYINEAAYKTISCTTTERLKNLGKILYKLKCKWENQAEKGKRCED